MSAQPLRPYQRAAVGEALGLLKGDTRSVVVVIPTGGGKTRVAEEFAWIAHRPTMFVAHRRELIAQTAARFALRLGFDAVGSIMAGVPRNPSARVQVGTIQTLLEAELVPNVGLMMIDECHHYANNSWSELRALYPAAKLLGFTATPERGDGAPLGNTFERLVVGAKYSELLADGFLVQCRVFQPPETMGSDIALSPVEAYARYCPGVQAFAFFDRVAESKKQADLFSEAGIPAGSISAGTPARERDALLERFRAGELRVLCNVDVLTEGVDVPQAGAVLLCKNYNHAGGMLQAAGRVLRPFPGKAHALIVDLKGSTLKHGLPTADRAYSLEGKAIRAAVASLTTCLACHAVYESGTRVCPACGNETPVAVRRAESARVRNQELVEAGLTATDETKAKAWESLKTRGVLSAVMDFKKRFSVYPVEYVDNDGLDRELFDFMVAVQERKGGTSRKAAGWFKGVMGRWPARDLL